MASFSLPRLVTIVLIFGLLLACQKNAAPSSEVLTEKEKTVLLSQIAQDTLFKQWQENQKRVFESMKNAVQTSTIDTAKLKAVKDAKTESEHVDALKRAGMHNAEEFTILSNRSREIMKQLWAKYPNMAKLSQNDLADLARPKTSTTQKP